MESMQKNELDLRKIRNESGISLKEIAKNMGRSRSHLERLEKDIKDFRVWEIEKYLGLIGYGVDFIEFIKEIIDPKSVILFTQDELNQAVETERKKTNFYYQENFKLTVANEELKKELEEYKRIILKLTSEKYSK